VTPSNIAYLVDQSKGRGRWTLELITYHPKTTRFEVFGGLQEMLLEYMQVWLTVIDMIY